MNKYLVVRTEMEGDNGYAFRAYYFGSPAHMSVHECVADALKNEISRPCYQKDIENGSCVFSYVAFKIVEADSEKEAILAF